MSTPSRAQTNRENAQKSTGPRTATGKRKTALNALRHGLTGRTVVLPADDLDLYRTHVKSITAGLRPEGPEETQLATLIADNYWRLQRIHAIEDGILAIQFAQPDAWTGPGPVDNVLNQAQAYLDHSVELSRLTLYESRIHRNIKTATARLEELQRARRIAQAQAEPRAAKAAASASQPSAPPPDRARAATNGSEFSSTESASKPPRPLTKAA
jgi:hypothetical protein